MSLLRRVLPWLVLGVAMGIHVWLSRHVPHVEIVGAFLTVFVVMWIEERARAAGYRKGAADRQRAIVDIFITSGLLPESARKQANGKGVAP